MLLDKNIHSTLVSLLNTTGMTNLMIIHISYLEEKKKKVKVVNLTKIKVYCTVKGKAVPPRQTE